MYTLKVRGRVLECKANFGLDCVIGNENLVSLSNEVNYFTFVKKILNNFHEQDTVFVMTLLVKSKHCNESVS